MPLEDKDCAISYKVLVLGDCSVGKTALMRSLAGLEFRERRVPTAGPDFTSFIFEVDGALVQLQIWDSPGYEKLRSITKQQYSGVQGLVLVYDVTDELSFQSLIYWLHSINNDIESKKSQNFPTPLILIGNKSDLISSKKISTAKAEQLAEKELMFGFYETSAKTGENVVPAFHRLAYLITELHNPKLMTSYHPYLIRRKSKIISKQTLLKINNSGKKKDETPENKQSQEFRPKQLSACKPGDVSKDNRFKCMSLLFACLRQNEEC